MLRPLLLGLLWLAVLGSSQAQQWSHETITCDATNSVVVMCDRSKINVYSSWLMDVANCRMLVNCTTYHSVCNDGECVGGSLTDVVMIELARRLIFWIVVMTTALLVCWGCLERKPANEHEN